MRSANLLQLRAALQQQAATLEATAAHQQEALASQHAADLAKLKQVHADAHQQQLQQHAGEVEALQQRHAQALLQQAEAHAAELQAAVDKAAREAEALRLAAAGSQTELEQHIRWVGANLFAVRAPRIVEDTGSFASTGPQSNWQDHMDCANSWGLE